MLLAKPGTNYLEDDDLVPLLQVSMLDDVYSFQIENNKGRPWPSGRPLLVRILPGTLDSFMLESYPASLLNVGGSTQVTTSA